MPTNNQHKGKHSGKTGLKISIRKDKCLYAPQFKGKHSGKNRVKGPNEPLFKV
jgi:hypothetical protein